MNIHPDVRSTWSRQRRCARMVALAIAFGVLAPGLSEAATAVTVSWDRNPDSATIGYYVYYGTESHKYTTGINVGNTTTAVIYLPDPTLTYYFAVQAYSATGERSQLSPETVFTPAQAPTLLNPGNQSGVVGLSVSLQLSATDPRGLPLTYSAGGLPPGLSISSSSGRISGAPSTAGNYTVTVAATNTAGISSTQFFTWAIVGPTTGIGGGGGSIGTPPPASGAFPGGGGGTGGGGTGGGGGVGTYPPTSPGSGNPTGGGGSTTNPGTGGVDLEAPKIIVLSPSTAQTDRTTNVRIIATGIASDNVGVVSVMWANDRGGVGQALGTSSWATTPIDLKMGDNVITITATDAAGNVGTVTFTIKRFADLENHLN